MVIPFAVGLTIFLFGMQIIKIGLSNLANHRIQEVLAKGTKTTFHGFLVGTFTTMLVQSSSAVTVMTIGLTNARLLTFPQTVGIILGTNVGTTVTGEIIALNIQDFAIPLFLLGAILWLLPNRILRCIGLSVAGLGCIFIGMETMQYIKDPLGKMGFFQKTVVWAEENNVIGVILGTVISAVIQSSSATTAIAMGFVGENLIPLSLGIAIVLGSNIGTCATALLASIGGNTAAKRVAWAHVILNVIGVLIFIPFIGLLTVVVLFLSDHPPAQVAHAQTVFNLVCSLAALPFAKPFARFIELLLPEES